MSPMLNSFRIVLRVVTLSGRELPLRTIYVRAEDEAAARAIATGVAQLLEAGPVRRPETTIERASLRRENDISLEDAVVLAVTGSW